MFRFDAPRGKVALINVWAGWCPPCREEMPLLDAFYRKYRAQGAGLLASSADDAGDEDGVRRIMQRFSFPSALLKKATVTGFGVPRLVPISHSIDPRGVVHAELRSGGIPLMPENLDNTAESLLPPITRGK